MLGRHANAGDGNRIKKIHRGLEGVETRVNRAWVGARGMG